MGRRGSPSIRRGRRRGCIPISGVRTVVVARRWGAAVVVVSDRRGMTAVPIVSRGWVQPWRLCSWSYWLRLRCISVVLERWFAWAL